QIAEVAASKQLIYEGFKRAVAAGVPKERAGILVDEEFGAAILRDAVRRGFLTAMPVEKSGQNEFGFEYGAKFTEHIEAFNPTFVRVLVRYNPEGDAAGNAGQVARLKRLSENCHATGRRYMFEMLVPAEPAQLQKVHGDKKAYDLQLRPGLMVGAIQQIQDGGVEPDVWKVEGLDRRGGCAPGVGAGRGGGRGRGGRALSGRRVRGR